MKKKVSGLIIGLFAFCLAVVPAKAGGINSAEQKIINAASQAFTYDGKQYVVGSSYLSEGISRLSEDGIDLTDSEADSYIQQFRDSYQELVEERYCTLLASEGDDSEEEESKHSKSESKENKAFLKVFLGDPSEEEDSETASKTETASDTEAAPGTETASDAAGETEEDIGTDAAFTKKDIRHAEKQKLSMTGTLGDYTLEGQEDRDLNDIIHLGLLWKVAAGCTVLAVLAAGGLVFYQVKYRSHRKKNRRLRGTLAVFAGIDMGVFIFLMLAAFGLHFGLYNNNAIHKQMMESDYFSGLTQMTRTLAQEALEREGKDPAIANRVFSLSSVYIEEKQYIEDVLNGKEHEISADPVHESLTGELDEEEDAALIGELEGIYTDMLEFPLGSLIQKSRSAFRYWFYFVLAAGLLSIAVLFILLEQIYGYLHKAVRTAAYAAAVPSVLVTGAAGAAVLKDTAGGIETTPVYYQQFLQKYAGWDITVLFYVGCIGILVAFALFIWKQYLHRIYVE